MKKGSSMLELVVAIVVMGIAMMTLPLILTQVKSNNEFSMQQEAILATRTKLGDILTYAWDEQNTLGSGAAVVLDTNDTGSDTELNKNSTSRRVGHVIADKRRKFLDTTNLATAHNALGSETGEATADYDDIDDFNTEVQQLSSSATSTFDYKFTDINLTTRVVYIDDNASYSQSTIALTLDTANVGRRSNIKMIEVNATNAQINFVLRSYSSNIGESELLRRTW